MSGGRRTILVLAPLALITGPAVWWLRGEDAPLVPLLYYAVLGVVATFALLWWFGRQLTPRSRRRRGRASSRRELVHLTGLGLGPGDDRYEELYPDLADRIGVIKDAITREAELVFHYDTDGRSHERRVLPSYLHEYTSSRNGKVSLCVNAYYFRKQSNVNFSVNRMTELNVID